MPKSAYDKIREAEFREEARAIVTKDRYMRKYHRTVDTAGAIRRALEKAYQKGRIDEAEGEPRVLSPKRPGAMFWDLIPPRPRRAFWSICLRVLGQDEHKTSDKTYALVEELDPKKRTIVWRLYVDYGDGPKTGETDTWGKVTISPLAKLGLLVAMEENPYVLHIADKGHDTWWEGIEMARKVGHDFMLLAH